MNLPMLFTLILSFLFWSRIGKNSLKRQRKKRLNLVTGLFLLSIQKNFELWHYKYGENPIAEKISQHIVNLPTHTKITEDYVAPLAKFLKKNRDNIYSSFGEIVK